MFDCAPDGLLVTSSGGRIREANRFAARLLRVPRRDLLGRELALFVSPPQRRFFRSKLSRLRAGRSPEVAECEVRLHPPGSEPIETALALTLTFLVEPGHLSLARAIELWTEAPRRIFGLPEVSLAPGTPADLVLFDPGAEWTVEPGRFRSRCQSCP